MISTHLYQTKEKSVKLGGLELLDKWDNDPDTLIWINIDGELTDKTANVLEQRFGLHHLGIQDARQNRHPPKLEAFDDHTLIILKGLPAGIENIESKSIQIAIFIGERFMVTRHSAKSTEIEDLTQEMQASTALFDQGMGAITTRLCRMVVNRYLKIIMQLEPRLEELENNLMGDAGEEILSELITHKSNLTFVDRIFFYHVDLSDAMTKKTYPGFSKEDSHLLIDIQEQQKRGSSLTSMYYRLASDLIDGYISVSSHRLNQIMKILTIVTAIFIPLGFLAGLYGMNFEVIPELKFRYGYFILIGIMATIATVLMIIFRRKKWL